MSIQEQIEGIEQRQAAVRRYVAETRKPDLAPWPFAIGGMVAGALIFGAGMASAQLFGV